MALPEYEFNEDTLQHLKEHHIDLLLLKELKASETFRQWFVQQIKGSDFIVGKFEKVEHSVDSFNGESDLELTVSDSQGQQWIFLIENKITAALQPRQAKRYSERGEHYKTEQKCADFTTAITAPRRYLGNSKSKKGFDATISYEAIREWLASSGAHEGDLTYHNLTLAMLDAAIENQGNNAVTAFWHAYWEMAQKYIPTLGMSEPGRKPADATFICFQPTHWPKEVQICHKLHHGYVDLQFNACGDSERFERLKNLFASKIQPGMYFVKIYKSGAIRLDVPVIDALKSFDEQEKEIRIGMLIAQHLYNWFENQLPLWKVESEKVLAGWKKTGIREKEA